MPATWSRCSWIRLLIVRALSSAVLAELLKQFAAIEMELVESRRRFSNSHPRIDQLEERAQTISNLIKEIDPRGRPIYWVGPAGSEQDAGPGTDFHAVRNGYVSVTPIHVDLTRIDALDQVKACLGDRLDP